MSTITVPRADVTSAEVSEALRNGLGPRYNVLPGMRMTRNPFGKSQPDQLDAIVVSSGLSNRVWRAQVTITRRSGQTYIRVSPGGLLGQLLVNTLWIAPKVRRVLLDAPGLGSWPSSYGGPAVKA